MDFQMIDEIKVETKMFKYVDLKSVFIIFGFTVFGVFMRENVYSLLQIPFIIFNFAVGFVFCMKSRWNRGKRLWQSLLLYLQNLMSSKSKYHAVECECYKEDIIVGSQLMYNKKYLEVK